MVRIRVRIRVRVRVRVRIRVRVKNTAGGGGCGLIWLVWFGLVWNDDVCIRRARSTADSDILVSAKLQLYQIIYSVRLVLRIILFE